MITKAQLRNYVQALEPENSIWIDGKGRKGSSGACFGVIDPATASEIAQLASGTSEDARAAVDAAARALPAWADTSPRDRSGILRRAFEKMLAKQDELAAIMSWENGKSYADARAEIAYAAEFFRWYSEEAVRSQGEFTVAPSSPTRTIVTTRPVGVAALITPWNFPTAMATRKMGPALAAGCTVVLKPASQTPISALAVMRILQEAGLPDGVANMVTSRNSAEISQAWLSDERVRALSFTGSTPVGRTLLGLAARRVVKTSMELGGNAPFIVGKTADVDQAVEGAMVAKFRNSGQVCVAANRFIVHEDVAPEFIEKFTQRVRQLRVGSAFAEGTEIGPLINARAVQNLTQLIDAALERGARLVGSAHIPTGAGYYLAPQVIVVDSGDDPLLKEELFGPVAVICTYRGDAEMLQMVNNTEMGLAAYIFGDLQWALRNAEKIEAGMVGINRGAISDPAAPFGGVKQSGIGREGGREGIAEFQEIQYYSVAW
ncbi:MAG: NAD-dependent succinate-semialdehyde dehydrogenase [Actinomycetaceae bacterium]|nr:NAD-dependent succinate-semialdehyde dehydrogenase [Actinomycetaceae bacterium]